jgi:hypothetical protein
MIHYLHGFVRNREKNYPGYPVNPVQIFYPKQNPYIILPVQLLDNSFHQGLEFRRCRMGGFNDVLM